MAASATSPTPDIRSQLEAFNAKMDAQFEKISTRLDDLDKRVDALKTSLFFPWEKHCIALELTKLRTGKCYPVLAYLLRQRIPFAPKEKKAHLYQYLAYAYMMMHDSRNHNTEYLTNAEAAIEKGLALDDLTPIDKAYLLYRRAQLLQISGNPYSEAFSIAAGAIQISFDSDPEHLGLRSKFNEQRWLEY